MVNSFFEMNSSAGKVKNIMRAFHYIRQAGILFERQVGERILCVLFTTHDKGLVFLKGERDGTVCVRFSANKVVGI